MARPGTIPYAEALDAIQAVKRWPKGLRFDWKTQSSKKFPAPYSFRAPLSINPDQSSFADDWFVDCSFKKSIIVGVNDSLSISLVVNNARIIGVDDNGPSRHINKVGSGMPYYQKTIGHPHLHRPVEEASYGYAEPLEAATVQSLWELFLKEAHITEAPRIELPDFGQMGFSL